MTERQAKIEMQENGYSFIKKSWFYVTIAVFILTTGINIGISQNQLASKVDEPKARLIAKEEVATELKHFFSDSDGKVLQSQIKDLKEKMDKIDQKLDRLLSRK